MPEVARYWRYPGPSCLSRCHVWRDIILTIADGSRLLLLATSLSLSPDLSKITQSCIKWAHTCPLNMPHVIHNAINTIVSLWDYYLQLYAGLLMALLNAAFYPAVCEHSGVILASDPGLSMLDNVGASVISVSCVFDMVTARVSPLK